MTADAFLAGEWATATGDEDGKPVLYRVRIGRPEGLDPEEYPHQITVLWTYEPGPDGLPTSDVLARMEEFEKLLGSVLQPQLAAVMVAVVTGTGVREWMWYARDPEKCADLVKAAVGDVEEFPYPVEFTGLEDPTWQAHDRARELVASLLPAN